MIDYKTLPPGPHRRARIESARFRQIAPWPEPRVSRRMVSNALHKKLRRSIRKKLDARY